jgi:predicted nucleic acid-binding protein
VYLLDTNILSEVARSRPHPEVLARFRAQPDSALFTSAICIEEIYFGIAAGPDRDMVRQRMEDRALFRVTVLAFDKAAAELAGTLRGEWKLRGTPVGYRDGLIAATARHHGLVLVTRNARHFDHVTALRIENWFEP